MTRIDDVLLRLRSANAKAIMPFIVGGHPRPGDTARLLAALERGGAHVVEIGFPFSDPIADGPVIAAAMHEALLRGASPTGVFDEVRRARASGVQLGIVAMVSVSIAWRLGPEAMIRDAKSAGIDGFIFPDAPVDEASELSARVRDAGLTCSLLVAPTTSAARAERIVQACSGFVYLLARAGITGESSGLPEIASRVKMLRGMTSLPIACGFGIGTAEHVRHVVHAEGADAAIVGSALVRGLDDAAAKNVTDIASVGEAFVRGLSAGLKA
jgi:tryptophan synthase alpha chain